MFISTKQFTFILVLSAILFTGIVCRAQVSGPGDSMAPHLVTNNGVTQLYVDQKPFLILGGELNNSSSSDMNYMKPIWKQVKALNFNTLLTPLSWELIEPKEGEFNFTLVDSLITAARQNNMHLVFLWLASWKNGMSSYMPLWVKANYKKFSRVKNQKGQTVEVLSTLDDDNWQADAKAFAALMQHIKKFDGTAHTVLMMQVENEVGILADSRDRCAAAEAAFNAPVPKELINYLKKNKETLVPEVKQQWAGNGFKISGNWADVFGSDVNCDEIFMAWHYGKYVNKVTAAGKKEYPIPMYANAWLDQGDNPKPGSYPSGGPLARVMDIWQAATTAVDLFAPDLYVAEYDERCQKFTQHNNPLFIPEMNSSDDGARNIFIAIGKYNAIGVSPFGIDHVRDAEKSGFTKSYDVLNQLSALILEKQAKKEITGFVVDEKHPLVTCEMGGYKVEISLDEIFGHRSKLGYGLVMIDGKDKFIGAGMGFRVKFYPLNSTNAIIGIAGVDEGTFRQGLWVPGRRLNGDENDQGHAWRFSPWAVSIEKCSVYTYQ